MNVLQRVTVGEILRNTFDIKSKLTILYNQCANSCFLNLAETGSLIFIERVTLFDVPCVKATFEPIHPLFRSAMSKSVGYHMTL